MRYQTLSFFVLPPRPGSCGNDDGKGHRQVAGASSGAASSLCSSSIIETIERIVETMAGQASTYDFPLKATPIPSTLDVRVGGQKVSRGFPNGWKWSPARHATIFHGTAVPAVGTGAEAVTILFDSFK